MMYRGVDLVCPACLEDLRLDGDLRSGSLHCSGCAKVYPIVAGIPDLRLWPDPYISFEQDRAKGMMLDEHCAQLSFAAAVKFYYNVTEKVPPFQAQRFTRSLMVAPDRARDSLERWESMAVAADGRNGVAAERATLLEIGCGTAPLLVNAAPRYASVVGVDIAFRWLVLARKRLSDAGLDDVPLICACAEALPFRERVFDRVVADSTIEHLRDADAALRQCSRVTRPGAWLYIATPNRYSIGPDPHAGLPAGGWLPDRLVGTYVRLKGGIAPQRQLQSRGSLRRALERADFDVRSIWAPQVPPAQAAGLGRLLRFGVATYNLSLRTPPGRFVFERIGPLLHAVAQRSAGRTPPSSVRVESSRQTSGTTRAP